jgi:chromatin remodeling complex protein RSC6
MAKKTARKAAKGSKKKTVVRKRTANAAFMRPVTPDATVAEVVGSKPIPRTEVTKRLWAYIKKNGLQDKKNRRMINADASLKAVFGGKSSVNMFEMTKLVNKHLK